MSEDLKWELTILEVVHGFYLTLLQQDLNDGVPIPERVDTTALHDPQSDLADSLAHLRRWLRLLDMAISPAKLREMLTENIDQDLSEALLRYHARKQIHSDSDRDKCDFLATLLYRNPRIRGQWDTHGFSLDGVAPVPPFEIALMEVMGDSELSEIDPSAERLLRDLEDLEEKVRLFKSFEEITENGVIRVARDLKRELGDAFFHPHALARIAIYNVEFSKKFEELFAAGTQRIKVFAQKTQEQGISAAVRVHDDVTVRQLMEVEDKKILRAEYVQAQEQLRHVTRLIKAVEARLNAATAQRPAAQAPQIRVAAPAAAMAAAAAPKPVAAPSLAVKPAVPGGVGVPAPSVDIAAEISKLAAIEHSIKSFVRAANPKFRQIVPMKFGNLSLTAGEADAFCAEYVDESSFRGDNARSLVKLAALHARACSELAELKQRMNSNHLWRQHSESLKWIADSSTPVFSEAQRVAALAQQRGLAEKAAGLLGAIAKLQERLTEANDLVAQLAAKATAGV